MEHPYLFFVKLFEFIGLGHFAHAYPHVVYSWVVMLLLVGLGFLGAKGIAMVPNKMQNFFEIIVSGIEDFMVDVTGEEGRWLFPLVATIFIYIFIGNLIGLVPGFFPPTASLNTTLSCALVVVVFHPRHRRQISRHRLYQAFYGARMVDGPHHLPHRTYRPPCQDSVPLFPAFWKHDGSRTGAGYSVCPGGRLFCSPAHHGPGHLCRAGTGVRFFSPVDHVFYRCHGTRTLMEHAHQLFEYGFLRFNFAINGIVEEA